MKMCRLPEKKPDTSEKQPALFKLAENTTHKLND